MLGHGLIMQKSHLLLEAITDFLEDEAKHEIGEVFLGERLILGLSPLEDCRDRGLGLVGLA